MTNPQPLSTAFTNYTESKILSGPRKIEGGFTRQFDYNYFLNRFLEELGLSSVVGVNIGPNMEMEHLSCV
jgi:hypothetical protein